MIEKKEVGSTHNNENKEKMKKNNKFPYMKDLKSCNSRPDKMNYLSERAINYLGITLRQALERSQIMKLENIKHIKTSVILTFFLPKGVLNEYEDLLKAETEEEFEKLKNLKKQIDLERNDTDPVLSTTHESIVIFDEDICSNTNHENLTKKFSEKIEKILNIEINANDLKSNLLRMAVEKLKNDYCKEACVCENRDLSKNKLYDKNIMFIANIICYLTGLKCEIYIDPFKFLNLEFYADSNSYDLLAEKYNYDLQLKIIQVQSVYDYAHKKEIKAKEFFTRNKDRKIVLDHNEKNCIPYEMLNYDDVSAFPSYMKFSIKNRAYFRRYLKDDSFHSCEHPFNKLSEYEDINNEEKKSLLSDKKNTNTHKNHSYECILKEECSAFRNIDKIRLVNFAIISVINISNLKKTGSFSRVQFIRNRAHYSKIFKDSFFWNYISLFQNKNIKRNNFTLRNFYGERVAYYFCFLSHYISWLVFPVILGIVFNLSMKFFDHNSQLLSKITKTYKMDPQNIIYLIYIFASVIWGNLFTRSWSSAEKFYNHVFGMNDFNLELSEFDSSKLDNAITYLGVFIPVKNGVKKFFTFLLSYLVVILMIIISIFVYISLFYLENVFLYENEGGVRDFVKASSKINEVRSDYWQYMIPILTTVARNIMSTIYYSLMTKLTNFEKHLRTDYYDNSFITKIFLFEFINYYFNLYYIAFIKNYNGSCTNNDCFTEVGHQLTVIFVTSNILCLVGLIKPLIKAIFKKKYIKGLLNKQLEEKNPRLENYSRQDYNESMTSEYLEIIFIFGYIIQFGVTSPICYALALLHAFAERLIDSYKLVKLSNVPIIGIIRNYIRWK